MSGCCGHDVKFDGASPAFRRALWAVIALGLGLFAGRMMAGPPAWSPEGDRLLVPVAPVDAPEQSEIYLVKLTTPLGR